VRSENSDYPLKDEKSICPPIFSANSKPSPFLTCYVICLNGAPGTYIAYVMLGDKNAQSKTDTGPDYSYENEAAIV
jgi:hypothetical protein